MWYADDATGGGKLQQLRRWWDKLNEVGPAFGYFPNATKTWLVVKETELAAAQELFRGSGVQITADGHRLLGAPIGTQSFCKNFTERTVANWKLQLEALSTVARPQPQAAYAAFTHGFIGKWTFLARTTAIGELFSPRTGRYDQKHTDPITDRPIVTRRRRQKPACSTPSTAGA